MFSFHHVALSVRQLDASVAWYAKLGFAEVHRWQAEDASLRIVQLKLGAVMLELFCFADNAEASAETSALFSHLRQLGPRHFGLQVDSVEAAREAMIRANMTTESVVVTEGKTGSAISFCAIRTVILLRFWKTTGFFQRSHKELLRAFCSGIVVAETGTEQNG